ncbi:hypothetical protein GW796_10270 [archaeon]|nr:hypothetical protein [archaeon]
MSKVTIRNLVLFLLVNVLLASFIAINYFFKNNEVKPSPSVSTVNVETKIVPQAEPSQTKIVPQAEPSQTKTVDIKDSTNIISPTNSNEPNRQEFVGVIDQNTKNSLVCVMIGPLNIEEKGTIDFILNKNKELALAQIEKRVIYQIYWNLGKNKAEAEKIFKKQKEGAMADPKFSLIQDENDNWIVNIVKVNTSKGVAEKLTSDLSAKAQTINAGGKWDQKALPEGYFYIFKNFKELSPSTINGIDVMLSPTKEPC